MAKRSTRPTPPEAASDRADRMLVNAAIAKIQRGDTPSSAERAALKRFEREQEETRRWHYYRTAPKRHYCEMAERPRGVVIDQARRYGLPYPGQKNAKVDLTAVIKWLHDFLAANKTRLNAPQSDDPMMAAVDSPALERYRDERAKLARIERLQKEGELLPRQILHEAHGRMAAILRSAGEILGRQFGPEAQAILSQSLDDAQREIQSMFAVDDQ